MLSLCVCVKFMFNLCVYVKLWGVSVSCVCVCEAGGRREAEQTRDTESKTRTPHKVVGKKNYFCSTPKGHGHIDLIKRGEHVSIPRLPK